MKAKNRVILLVKVAVSIGLITWLFLTARDTLSEMVGEMVERPQRWDLFALAGLLCFVAVSLTFLRWCLLVRALGLPFAVRDAFRLGFLGYFCNFFALGAVGGDLIKAVFIAREQPKRRAEAVATVVVDRMIGLYALFIVATVAILVAGLQNSADPGLRMLCRFTFIATALGGIAILMLLVPGFTSGALSEFLTGLPKVGPTIGRLIIAVRMYRRRLPLVFVAGLMSMGTHTTFSVALYLVASGLPGDAPGLAAHLVIVPMAMLVGAMPVTVGGVGAFEGALVFFYTLVPVGIAAASLKSMGLLVGLTYRLITIAIALVGAGFYFTARRELKTAVEAAESVEERDTEGLADAATLEVVPNR